jgi:hypothetical protein
MMYRCTRGAFLYAKSNLTPPEPMLRLALINPFFDVFPDHVGQLSYVLRAYGASRCIKDDPVFQNNSTCPQAPVKRQLAVTVTI